MFEDRSRRLPIIHHLRSRLHGREIRLLVIAVLVVGVVFAWTAPARAASSNSRSGMHILNVHDGSEEHGVLTEASTVGEALKAADIELAPNDVTEPALDEVLVAANYDITIYRARPVIVIDGGNRTKVMTPYHTAKQIAEQAGLSLHDEDHVALQNSGDVAGDGALERMVVTRATEVNFIFYGKTTTAYTTATTISEMLQAKNITMTSEDGISPVLTTPITAGMTIKLWREGKQTVTVDEAVVFSTREINDTNYARGYRDVQSAGKNGQRTVTYEITIQDGVEVARTEITSVVTEQPVEEVVVVGAKNSGGLTKSMGVNMFTDSNGVTHRETYYDLPMSVVMGNCGAGGVYNVRDDGAKVDKDGYVLVAANLARYPRCSLVETSIGTGKVYDTGGFAAVHPDGFDLATDWSNNNGR